MTASQTASAAARVSIAAASCPIQRRITLSITNIASPVTVIPAMANDRIASRKVEKTRHVLPLVSAIARLQLAPGASTATAGNSVMIRAATTAITDSATTAAMVEMILARDMSSEIRWIRRPVVGIIAAGTSDQAK